MKPLKIATALALVLIISGCTSGNLEEIEFDSITLSKKTNLNKDSENENCETAYAKFHPFCKWDGYVFSDGKKINPDGFPSLGWKANKWGWVTNIPDNHNRTQSFELWAGAAQNNTAKGTLVGDVEFIRTNNSDLTVNYTTLPGYHLESIHIYVGDIKPMDLGPGQYGFTREFSEEITNFSADFSAIDTDSDGIWVIAHAVVCED